AEYRKSPDAGALSAVATRTARAGVSGAGATPQPAVANRTTIAASRISDLLSDRLLEVGARRPENQHRSLIAGVRVRLVRPRPQRLLVEGRLLALAIRRDARLLDRRLARQLPHAELGLRLPERAEGPAHVERDPALERRDVVPCLLGAKGRR